MQRMFSRLPFRLTPAASGRWLSAAWRSPWLVLFGTALIAAGQYVWYQDTSTFWKGALLAGAGMLLTLAAVRPARSRERRTERAAPQTQARSGITPRWLLAGAGIGLSVYAGWSGVEAQHSVWAYLALWLGGVVLVVAGLAPWADARAWFAALRASVRHERRTWLLLGVLFVGALLMRATFLETVPPIQAGDEAQFAYEALAVARDTDWRFSPFEMGIWHHPRTVHTLMAISIEALGQTKTAARLPWALFGALTVPAVYVLGRALAGSRVGWAAALFMLTFPVHVQFSRTGMDMTGDPFFAALAFPLLARAFRTGNRMDAALGGAAGGLTQYFYFAGRIVPVLLAGYVALWALTSPREVRRRIGPLVIFTIVFAVTVFPYFYGAVRDTERPLNPRLDSVGVWQTATAQHAFAEGHAAGFWKDQVYRGLMAYLQISDKSDVYGYYGAMLGWFEGMPFLIGVAAAVRRWRSPDALIPVIWALAVGIFGGALLVDPPHYPRYISATPALAVLVGVGLVTLGQALARVLAAGATLRPRAIGQLRRGVPVLLAIGLMVANGVVYVFDYVPRPLLYGERTKQLNDVAAILDTLNGEYEVHTLSSLHLSMYGTDILRYLTPENAGTEYTEATDEPPKDLAPGRHAFVISPARLDEFHELVHWLPDGELRQYINPRTEDPLVYLYLIDVK